MTGDPRAEALAFMLERFPELREYLASVDPSISVWDALQSYREVLRLRVVQAADQSDGDLARLSDGLAS